MIMIAKAKIIKGMYLDSVKLMLISKELRGLQGVEDAVAIMATKENKDILAATGMLVEEAKTAKDSEIVVVVKAQDEPKAESAMQKAEELLTAPVKKRSGDKAHPGSIQAAVRDLDGADICLISVAGKYAAAEANKALDMGLHVMLFSDNVSVAEELYLKQKAVDKGLLMMGPDCGTAIINGVPLAFSNVMQAGHIGLVSASGTGLQEVCAGIAHRGEGISQAFGTGGRDGKNAIGGLMLCSCLDFLMQDADTKVIVLIAKTPDAEIQAKLWEKIGQSSKPVVVNFLKDMEVPPIADMQYCNSLEETAAIACAVLRGDKPMYPEGEGYPLPKPIAGRKYIRALYSGGTLCYEAMQMYKRRRGHYPKSNIASETEFMLKDVWHSEGDCFIDMGADDFTVGRPHPMIDFTLRLKKIAEEAVHKDVAVILLDVVLGYGSHINPAKELVPVLQGLDKEIVVVCHVLGTEDDPQHLHEQVKALKDAGARVFTSHRRAVAEALDIVEQGGV